MAYCKVNWDVFANLESAGDSLFVIPWNTQSDIKCFLTKVLFYWINKEHYIVIKLFPVSSSQKGLLSKNSSQSWFALIVFLDKWNSIWFLWPHHWLALPRPSPFSPPPRLARLLYTTQHCSKAGIFEMLETSLKNTVEITSFSEESHTVWHRKDPTQNKEEDDRSHIHWMHFI